MLDARDKDIALSRARRSPRADLAKHRNLYNADTVTSFYHPELWQPEGGRYPAKAIHRFIENLAQNGVDTFLANPSASHYVCRARVAACSRQRGPGSRVGRQLQRFLAQLPVAAN